MSDFSVLPSVETLTQGLAGKTPLPRPLLVHFIRRKLQEWRSKIKAGASPEKQDIETAITADLLEFAASRLRPVINASGVIIHTNLGRSPIGHRAAEALAAVATGYSNLEFDLPSGERGERGAYLETALATVLGAEKATAVNNCAAALVVTLRHLISLKSTHCNEAIVSRGELVEIGGGFRIPDILETSGARLVEAGTTNKTHLSDYANAITEKTALILKVHRSNFYLGGFTHAPSLPELANLARQHGLPLVEDLGSGALVPMDRIAPVEHEPTPMEALAGGIDLVTFSGDKLLGSSQSGIIAGRDDLVEGIKRDPFFRAIRCDKLILATLQETIDSYLLTQASGSGDHIPMETLPPVLAFLSAPPQVLRQRAKKIAASLPESCLAIEIVESTACTGGGTMPQSEIPSLALRLSPPQGISAEELASALRTGTPAIVPYIAGDALHFDLRTVFPSQDQSLAKRLREILFLPR